MSEGNRQIARLFEEMADVIEILGGDRFRALAFQKTARILRDLSMDVASLCDDPKTLTEIDGIGKGTAQRIVECVTTGKLKEHDELVAQVPEGLLDLLAIPGVGAKTVATLWKDGGVENLETLKAKLEGDALEGLKGLGKKKLDNIRHNLAFAESAGARVPLGRALPLAQWFVDQLRKLKAVKQAAFAGSVRRGRETIGDLDILVAAAAGDADAISDAFVNLAPVQETLARGATKTSIRTSDGVQVDLRIVEPDSFGAALMYFTGSKEHNVALRGRAQDMGLKLNEYGLARDGKSVAGKTEEEVYKALGLAWIPPELREDRGEVALAEKDKVPSLLTIDDIRCELHAHTTASDGKWSIRELAQACIERGFHTIAVTDHSKSQTIAGGLDAKRLLEHVEAVRAVAAELKGRITILAGSEVDILADGTLDYPSTVLKELDIVVASPHAALSQDGARATKRLLKAIHNPYVTILGHATGRLINRREGLSPDIHELVKAAAERGIAIEINANYHRLDLRDTHARAALDAGVKLSINTDAHGPADLDQLLFGILTARRAGATRDDVINCLSQSSLMRWIKSTRP
jgi:DNA polymerase (family X)